MKSKQLVKIYTKSSQFEMKMFSQFVSHYFSSKFELEILLKKKTFIKCQYKYTKTKRFRNYSFDFDRELKIKIFFES